MSRQRLDELCAGVERIADLLEARPEAADEAIVDFNAMTGHELVEIVRRVLMADPESDYFLRLLEANVSHPQVSELVFRSSDALDALEDASAEQIVEEALKHRPIAL